jgi:polysaccharide export outer membrane protein
LLTIHEIAEVTIIMNVVHVNRPSSFSGAVKPLIERRLRQSLLALAVACSSALGCGSGSFVWVQDAPDVYFHPKPAMTILPGDVISVKVFGQDPLSIRATVRPDGAVVMPLIGDVAVAGKLPGTVAREVEARLVPFVTTPNVVVVVEESRVRIVAAGEVHHPGPVVLEAGETGLLPALAAAGGLTEFAGESQIYVIRTEINGTYRIRFNYEDIIRGIGRAAAFRLRTGDSLVVE